MERSVALLVTVAWGYTRDFCSKGPTLTPDYIYARSQALVTSLTYYTTAPIARRSPTTLSPSCLSAGASERTLPFVGRQPACQPCAK